MCLFKLVFLFSDTYPGVELLSHMVILFLIVCVCMFCFYVFEKHPYCFTQCLHQFAVSSQCRRFPFSPYPHTYLLFVFFLKIVILTGVRFHCVFDLLFPDG